MVSGLLHNACLRMEATGTGVDDVLTPSGIHRWFGRSSLAVGGAASLAIGAILGGALEAVPVLLAPPAAASGTPQVLPSGHADTPWALAADAISAASPAAAPAPTPTIGAPDSSTNPSPCGSCVTNPKPQPQPQPPQPQPPGNNPQPVSSGNNPPPQPPGNNPPPPPPCTDPTCTVTQIVTQTVGTVTGVVPVLLAPPTAASGTPQVPPSGLAANTPPATSGSPTSGSTTNSNGSLLMTPPIPVTGTLP